MFPMEKLKYFTTIVGKEKLIKTVWVFTNYNCTEQNPVYNSPTDTKQLKGTVQSRTRFITVLQIPSNLKELYRAEPGL